MPAIYGKPLSLTAARRVTLLNLSTVTQKLARLRQEYDYLSHSACVSGNHCGLCDPCWYRDMVEKYEEEIAELKSVLAP